MKVTVTTEDGSLFTLEVSGDIELENFQALCEFESGIPASQVVVMFEGTELKDAKKSLTDYGIKEGDVVLMRRRRARAPASNQGTNFSVVEF